MRRTLETLGTIVSLGRVPALVLVVFLSVIIIGHIFSQVLRDCPPLGTDSQPSANYLAQATVRPSHPNATVVVTVPPPFVAPPPAVDGDAKFYLNKGNPLLCKTDDWWEVLNVPLRTAMAQARPSIAALTAQAEKEVAAAKNATPPVEATVEEKFMPLAIKTLPFIERDASSRVNAIVANALTAIVALLGGLYAFAMITRRVLLWRSGNVPLVANETAQALLSRKASSLPLLSALSVMFVLAAAFAAYHGLDWVLRDLVFAGFIHDSPEASYLYFFRDVPIRMLMEKLSSGFGYILTGRTYLLTFWGLATLAAVVTTLIALPVDKARYAEAKEYYIDRLRLQKERLRHLLYVSAAVMAASIYCAQTQYAWPLELIDRGAGATAAADGLRDFGGTMVTAYGTFFSAALLALFGTALQLVGNDARELAKALGEKDILAWLETNGLTAKPLLKLSDVTAVLAPTITGVAGALITAASS